MIALAWRLVTSRLVLVPAAVLCTTAVIGFQSATSSPSPAQDLPTLVDTTVSRLLDQAPDAPGGIEHPVVLVDAVAGDLTQGGRPLVHEAARERIRFRNRWRLPAHSLLDGLWATLSAQPEPIPAGERRHHLQRAEADLLLTGVVERIGHDQQGAPTFACTFALITKGGTVAWQSGPGPPAGASGGRGRSFVAVIGRLALAAAAIFILPLLAYPVVERVLARQDNRANLTLLLSLVATSILVAWAVSGTNGLAAMVLVALAAGGATWWSGWCLVRWEAIRAGRGR